MIFFVFHESDSFKQYCSVIFLNYASVWGFLVFLMITLKLYILGNNITQVMLCSLQWIMPYHILIYLLIGDVYVLRDHSVSAGFLLYKVTIFPFVMIKHLGDILLDYANTLLLLKFSPYFWHPSMNLVYNNYYCHVCIMVICYFLHFFYFQ